MSNDPGRHGEAEVFYDEISDDALEAAGQPPHGPAFSFDSAPTVSILFSCCGNNRPAGPA